MSARRQVLALYCPDCREHLAVEVVVREVRRVAEGWLPMVDAFAVTHECERGKQDAPVREVTLRPTDSSCQHGTWHYVEGKRACALCGKEVLA